MKQSNTRDGKLAYETILTALRGRVLLITLNRPEVMNALNRQVATDLIAATSAADADNGIGCIVLTGSDKAFAAGADIKEMRTRSFGEMHDTNWFAEWEHIARIRKPMVAAVSGYALGGGCELAMMCDFILASETAKFGQPEINLGTMPGIGGSQRLTRAVGKAKAMEMCLTGRMIDAVEAERIGLVARIFSAPDLLAQAMETAEMIASKSLPSTMMVKEAVNRAYETTLSEGLLFERRLFHATFALEDQKEGMTAFVEKRPPMFRHR